MTRGDCSREVARQEKSDGNQGAKGFLDASTVTKTDTGISSQFNKGAT